jgi:hypothetical protein
VHNELFILNSVVPAMSSEPEWLPLPKSNPFIPSGRLARVVRAGAEKAPVPLA